MEKEGDIPILIESFLAAVRQERYTFIKDLYIWKYPMSYENTATLVNYMYTIYTLQQLLYSHDCYSSML